MKKYFLIIATLFFTANIFAQKIILPTILKWETNNSPGCKNVSLTKDSVILAVTNKCMSEGVLANWRPSISVNSEALHFSIPSGAMVQLTIAYKFIPAGADVLSFYGSFDPESDNSDLAFSCNLQMENSEKSLPAANAYSTAIMHINFSSESKNPVWKASSALKGSMNFNLNITSTAAKLTPEVLR